MIKIYEPGEKNFDSNGLGNINPISCIETKKISISGWFLTVTVDSKYADLIVRDRIVTASTKEKGTQAFRIGNVKKKDRKIEFVAKHVLFDAERYVLGDVRPTNCNAPDFVEWCNDRTDSPSPFIVSGDATGNATAYFIRKTLLEAFESAEKLFSAIYDVDNFNIRILKPSSVGRDDGFSVVYGKNIQGVTIQESWDEVCTKILPLGTNGLTLPELWIQAASTYEIPYSKVVEFDVPDTDSDGVVIPEEDRIIQLRDMANDYLQSHLEPKISYTVKSDVPQEIGINDTVYIKHPLVTITAKVQEYTYDIESRRVKSLVFGNYDCSNEAKYKSQLEKVSAGYEKLEAADDYNKTILLNAIARATNAITGNSGGYVVLDPAENPERILIMDTDDIKTAKCVWQWNKSGLGYSSNGINGPYGLAMTKDGEIVADFVKVGTMTAERIKGGTLDLNAGDGTAIIAPRFRLDNSGKVHTESEDGASYADLMDGALEFCKDNKLLAQYGTTYWIGEYTGEDNKGVAINSEKDSTFISFGNKSQEGEATYKTKLLMNYGLNPQGMTEGIIFFGIPRFMDEVHINNAVLKSITMTQNEKEWSGIDTEYARVREKVAVGSTAYSDCQISCKGDMYLNGVLEIPSTGSLKINPVSAYNDKSQCLSIKRQTNLGGKRLYMDADNGDLLLVAGYNLMNQMPGQCLSLYGSTYLSGNLYVSGSFKTRVVETEDYNTRALYCYETASPYFGDIGSGRLDENGECFIYTDSILGETIDQTYEYHVFLQKYGEGDLYVASKTTDYFVVKGTPGLEFGWEMKARQIGNLSSRLENIEFGEGALDPEADMEALAGEYLREADHNYEEDAQKYLDELEGRYVS